MKYYALETITNGKTVKFRRRFATRNDAIAYAFAYLEKNYYNDAFEVEDEFAIQNDKHNVEYVLGTHARFRVNRVYALS